jgi:hypothetical protein
VLGGLTSFQGGLTGKWCCKCCRTAESDKAKERERKSAIVLDEPGVNTEYTVARASRQSLANCRKRKAGGPVVVGDPFDTHACVGVLSVAMYVHV